MGRKKIKIEPIGDARNRHVTFNKRKTGLLKKAMELAVLCDCEIGLVIFSHRGKLVEFASSSMPKVLDRYAKYTGDVEQRTTQSLLLLGEGDGDGDGDEQLGQSEQHSRSAAQGLEHDVKRERIDPNLTSLVAAAKQAAEMSCAQGTQRREPGPECKRVAAGNDNTEHTEASGCGENAACASSDATANAAKKLRPNTDPKLAQILSEVGSVSTPRAISERAAVEPASMSFGAADLSNSRLAARGRVGSKVPITASEEVVDNALEHQTSTGGKLTHQASESSLKRSSSSVKKKRSFALTVQIPGQGDAGAQATVAQEQNAAAAVATLNRFNSGSDQTQMRSSALPPHMKQDGKALERVDGDMPFLSSMRGGQLTEASNAFQLSGGLSSARDFGFSSFAFQSLGSAAGPLPTGLPTVGAPLSARQLGLLSSVGPPSTPFPWASGGAWSPTAAAGPQASANTAAGPLSSSHGARGDNDGGVMTMGFLATPRGGLSFAPSGFPSFQTEADGNLNALRPRTSRGAAITGAAAELAANANRDDASAARPRQRSTPPPLHDQPAQIRRHRVP